MTTTQNQLELTLDNAGAFQLAVRRERRPSRAQWWFAQMRQVVDRAFDWQTAPASRPEQICFADARGRIHP